MCMFLYFLHFANSSTKLLKYILANKSSESSTYLHIRIYLGVSRIFVHFHFIYIPFFVNNISYNLLRIFAKKKNLGIRYFFFEDSFHIFCLLTNNKSKLIITNETVTSSCFLALFLSLSFIILYFLSL